MSNRRSLLKMGSLAGLAAFVPEEAYAAASALSVRVGGTGGTTAAAPTTGVRTRSDFSALVGQTVRVKRGNSALFALQLVAVRDAGKVAPADRESCFSLLFRGRAADRLTQDTYLMTSRRGELHVFLVPVGRPANGLRDYEAVFNRPRRL
jgi:hypothetical protein